MNTDALPALKTNNHGTVLTWQTAEDWIAHIQTIRYPGPLTKQRYDLFNGCFGMASAHRLEWNGKEFWAVYGAIQKQAEKIGATWSKINKCYY